jgi:hypothetical protein
VGDALPSLSLTIDPTSDDPLWCKITGLGTVTLAGVELDITLIRRLAKVKIKLDCSYNNWKITGVADDLVTVAVNDPDYDCTLDWETGILSGTALDQGLSYNISDPTLTSQTSNEVTIIPRGSNAVIKIGIDAVSRDGLTDVPSAAKTATLAQALSGGVSYTIIVRLRVPIFARSNIYWVGTGGSTGYLTFVPAADDPADNVDTYAGYQGVFFKWGSLIGISPSGNFSGTTTIFVPVVNTTDLTLSTFSATTATSKSWASWSDIPYMDSSRGGTPGRGSTWLMDEEQNDLATITGSRGDICQYIGTTTTGDNQKGYRLPTAYEFGTYSTAWGNNREGWKSGGTPTQISSTNNSGTTDIITAYGGLYGKNESMDDVVFPASGGRDNDGTLTDRFTNGDNLGTMGTSGNYWTGSPHQYDDACYKMFFNSGSVYTSEISLRDSANPVRCVKK